MVICKHCHNRPYCFSNDRCIFEGFLDQMDDGVEELSEVVDFPLLVEEEEEREKLFNDLRIIMKKGLSFEYISENELLYYIKAAFRNDEKLLSSIHISPGTLDHCAQHTFETITAAGVEGLTFLKVEYREADQDELNLDDVGFLVIRDNPNCLLSFGLNIAYRNNALKSEWLKKIKSLFVPIHGIPYVVTVHDKNIRAINFFKRHGFRSQTNVDKTVSLWQQSSPRQLE